MNTATIRLNNSIMGWMLVPSYSHPSPVGGVGTILSKLYGRDWSKMSSGGRAFLKGETVDKVRLHVRKLCEDAGVRVSFCGNLKTPIVRLWWE